MIFLEVDETAYELIPLKGGNTVCKRQHLEKANDGSVVGKKEEIDILKKYLTKNNKPFSSTDEANQLFTKAANLAAPWRKEPNSWSGTYKGNKFNSLSTEACLIIKDYVSLGKTLANLRSDFTEGVTSLSFDKFIIAKADFSKLPPKDQRFFRDEITIDGTDYYISNQWAADSSNAQMRIFEKHIINDLKLCERGELIRHDQVDDYNQAWPNGLLHGYNQRLLAWNRTSTGIPKDTTIGEFCDSIKNQNGISHQIKRWAESHRHKGESYGKTTSIRIADFVMTMLLFDDKDAQKKYGQIIVRTDSISRSAQDFVYDHHKDSLSKYSDVKLSFNYARTDTLSYVLNTITSITWQDANGTTHKLSQEEQDLVKEYLEDFWKGAPTMDSIIATLNQILSGDVKQVVLTGAPGTGKTYSAQTYADSQISSSEQKEFVQFHQSYDYSDFVEGLRPIETAGAGGSITITFVKLDGRFKAFCRKIVEAGLEKAFPGFSALTKKEKQEKLEGLFAYEKQKFTEEADSKDRSDMFNEETLSRFDNLGEKYYFIIDEINRADLSKVFGELMYGLEESYRGISKRFATQYSNLSTYEQKATPSGNVWKPMDFDCFEKGFFIPKNLYIIGTMNDIDKSVEAFDFALRRRFLWVNIKTTDVMKSSLSGMLSLSSADLDTLCDRIKNMNDIISGKSSYGLSDAYNIGPAYFKGVTGLNDGSVNTVFERKIEPLLREYLRGRHESVIDDFVKDCRRALLG